MSINQLILIAGPMNSGKDTTAKILVDEHGYTHTSFATPLKEFVKLFFSIPGNILYGPSELRNKLAKEYLLLDAWTLNTWLKHVDKYDSYIRGMFKTKLDLPLDRLKKHIKDFAAKADTLTVREILQVVGTDWGRAIKDTIWIELAIEYMNTEDNVKGNFVISDCRFLNEATLVKSKVKNTKLWWIDSSRRVAQQQSSHSSEPTKSRFEGFIDGIIDNNGGQELLSSQVKKLLA